MSPTPTPSGLSIGGLETVYDQLASAIDQAGPAHSELLLVKLSLLLAQHIGDEAIVTDLIARAQRDLVDSRPV